MPDLSSFKRIILVEILHSTFKVDDSRASAVPSDPEVLSGYLECDTELATTLLRELLSEGLVTKSDKAPSFLILTDAGSAAVPRLKD